MRHDKVRRMEVLLRKPLSGALQKAQKTMLAIVVATVACPPSNLGATEKKSDIVQLVKVVASKCPDLAMQISDMKMYEFCLLEVLGPIISGPNCNKFAKAASSGNLKCDSDGSLYYRLQSVTRSGTLSKNEVGELFREALEGHSRRAIARCMVLRADDRENAETTSPKAARRGVN
jgi:hypothetical protein